MASLIISVGLLVSQPILADYNQPFSVEIHTGAVVPSDTIANVDVDAGFSFGTTVAYYFLDKSLGVYTGFEIDAFDADSVNNIEVSAALLYGYSLGLEYRGEISNSGFGYFARAGVHFSKLKLLDDDDDIRETKYDTGVETSAGFTYELGADWAFRGGIRYKTFSRRFKNSVSSNAAELDSTTLLLGARFNF